MSDFRANWIVDTKPNQIAAITASATSIRCAPKNTGVHIRLSANWIPKTHTAGHAFRTNNRPSAKPIIKYNTDHTGPKTHGGGVPGGLANA